nr:hypothetical protein [Tanacetum cinerariifolium]
MRMDREWMYNSRFLEGRKDYNLAFIDRVVSFVEFSCQQPTTDRDNDLIRRPCSSCKNRAYKSTDDIMVHVVTKGFVKNYYHEETEVGSSSMQPNCNTSSNGDNEGPNPYRNMILEAAGHDFNPNSHENVSQPQPPDLKTKRLYELLHQADEPLWPGCTKVSQLSLVSRMLNIKSKSRMTEKIYDDVMQVLEDALPLDSKLSKTGSKKRKIETPHRFMHYFPLIPRLQRLYASKVTTTHMRWHDEHVQEDGVMSHPSDAEAWKHFDQTYPPFAEETRNVRLGLCTDGFQPFRQSGKQYSCWPKGVKTYDISKENNFIMRAALLWTINDFSAYGMLSGWSTAGKKACPYCMENSKAFSLSNGGKVSWFDCHRQFLSEDHPFRRNKNDFIKNRSELSQSPLTLTGEQVIEQIDKFELKEVTEIGGAEFNASISISCGWRKHSIFWNLPYWKTNLIRHNLDVMHIEKNVFENVFETVMDIKGKTKDNAKARDDVKSKRKELEKNESTGKYPKSCYTLGKDEKKDCFLRTDLDSFRWNRSSQVSSNRSSKALRIMATTIEQQVALDEALVPNTQRLRIGRSNFRLPSDIQSKESTLQVVYDVLRSCPFFKAFLVTADVLEIYMQEFWATAYVHQYSIRFKLDNKKHIVNLETFRDMLHICPRIPGQSFDELPFEKEIMEFL